MRVLFDNTSIDSWTRWEDPGGHPGPMDRPGPLYPEEVSGYVLAELDEADVVQAFQTEGEDALYDLAKDLVQFEGCTTSSTAVQIKDNIFVFIPKRVVWRKDDQEIPINNPLDEEIIEQVRRFVMSKTALVPSDVPMEKPMENLTPEDISKAICEVIPSGRLGLTEQEEPEKEQIDSKEILSTVARLASHMDRYADELLKYSQTGDVRQARLILAELFGAVSQAKDKIDSLAQHYGLPDLKI